MDTEQQHTVESVVSAYLAHARVYYRGSREASNLAATLNRVVREHADLPVDEFRALRLQAWRARRIAEGLSRRYVNKATEHIRRCWRWAVSMELAEPETLESLRAVRGLARGRSDAVERPEVGPVSPEQILAILPHLTPRVAAIVELLRLTGARTGEIRRMRHAELDMDGVEVWWYRPAEHKTAHRGRARAIPLDEPCQRVLMPFLRPFIPDSYVLESPRGGPYGESSIRNAVAKACRRAGVPHFHPHQIRHQVLTEARAALGADVHALQAMAGHAHLSTTEIYARADEASAVRAQRALRGAAAS